MKKYGLLLLGLITLPALAQMETPPEEEESSSSEKQFSDEEASFLEQSADDLTINLDNATDQEVIDWLYTLTSSKTIQPRVPKRNKHYEDQKRYCFVWQNFLNLLLITLTDAGNNDVLPIMDEQSDTPIHRILGYGLEEALGAQEYPLVIIGDSPLSFSFEDWQKDHREGVEWTKAEHAWAYSTCLLTGMCYPDTYYLQYSGCFYKQSVDDEDDDDDYFWDRHLAYPERTLWNRYAIHVMAYLIQSFRQTPYPDKKNMLKNLFVLTKDEQEKAWYWLYVWTNWLNDENILSLLSGDPITKNWLTEFVQNSNTKPECGKLLILGFMAQPETTNDQVNEFLQLNNGDWLADLIKGETHATRSILYLLKSKKFTKEQVFKLLALFPENLKIPMAHFIAERGMLSPYLELLLTLGAPLKDVITLLWNYNDKTNSIVMRYLCTRSRYTQHHSDIHLRQVYFTLLKFADSEKTLLRRIVTYLNIAVIPPQLGIDSINTPVKCLDILRQQNDSNFAKALLKRLANCGLIPTPVETLTTPVDEIECPETVATLLDEIEGTGHQHQSQGLAFRSLGSA